MNQKIETPTPVNDNRKASPLHTDRVSVELLNRCDGEYIASLELLAKELEDETE